jgi:rhamnosyltransferase subunit B
VKFLANEIFRNLIEKQGLLFIQVGTASEYREILGNKFFFHPRKAFGFVTRHIILRYMPGFYYAILKEIGSESIIISQSFAPAPRIIHQQYSVPYISINLQPFSFWSYVHPPVYKGFKLSDKTPPLLKRHILEMVNKFYIDPKFASGIDPFLRELGLPVQKKYFSEWLYSPQLVMGVFPEWFARPAEDWPSGTKLTGFIALEEQNDLPSEIQGFLNNGEAPLVFTFGSTIQNAGPLFRSAIKAANELKKRAVLITNTPEDIGPDPGHKYLITRYVPFQKLFSHTVAIIHHGGIGTIAHAIAAGKPQLMVPFAHDQPDNAARATKLGVGITLNFKEFTSNVLAERIEQLLQSNDIKTQCSRYSAMVNFGESVERLVDTIEEFAFSQGY